MSALSLRRAGVIAAGLVVATGLGAAPAAADYGGGSSGGGASAYVGYEYSHPGSSGTPMTSTDVDWSPPTCWYEPAYKPKEFEEYLREHNYQGSAGADLYEQYFNETDGKYHQGDEGAWWELVVDLDKEDLSCAQEYDAYEFIGPGFPPPPGVEVLDPEMLAMLAYERIKLPTPPVDLKPGADRQIVNLETLATFGQDLEPAWVTAQIDHLGVQLAATTVATPSRLTLSADSAHADPAECSYDLVASGGGFTVDTEDAACNVTYRKSSGDGTYDLQASLTWEVAWNPSADPAGSPTTALPDGQSSDDIPVTVKEIQTVVR
ncbi:hypothetical protein AA958_27780 [Streptomyces sp. CNQ-509]|uniref:hypothetical protein n=1 Tax=Streptomyces sp. CNQ-509 TaxID=444103 RepID=UPI00062DF760|nr:hypothetical protein [Streptomyces sp. CNQ-509]AKH85404.1 hypothetical protein AA958_27780 [Streptomyces sp. CNQ-509]